MTSLTSLIERIEAATEGSRELDGCIYIAVNIPPAKVGRIDQIDGCVGWWPKGAPYVSAIEVPRYSTSIDAALTLLPEGWWLTLDRYCISDKAFDPFAWRVWLKRLVGDVDGDGPCGTLRFFATGATAHLALLAAIIRARQTEATP